MSARQSSVAVGATCVSLVLALVLASGCTIERRHSERGAQRRDTASAAEGVATGVASSSVRFIRNATAVAVTAAIGERAAMACTVAVEEAIDEHYAAQAESRPA